jgi:hypothetical protein
MFPTSEQKPCQKKSGIRKSASNQCEKRPMVGGGSSGETGCIANDTLHLIRQKLPAPTQKIPLVLFEVLRRVHVIQNGKNLSKMSFFCRLRA